MPEIKVSLSGSQLNHNKRQPNHNNTMESQHEQAPNDDDRLAQIRALADQLAIGLIGEALDAIVMGQQAADETLQAALAATGQPSA